MVSIIASLRFISIVLLVLVLAKQTVDATSIKTIVAFRNTSRFSYVHMTMIEKINATFYVMAFQADDIGEGSITQNIYMCKSFDAGSTWSDPTVIVTTNGRFPVWGPCFLFAPRQHKLFLYFSQSVPQNIRLNDGYPRHFPGGDLRFTTSDDFGETWSAATTILPYIDSGLPGGYGNVSKMTANTGPFLSITTNSWAIPGWCEPHNPPNKNDTGIQQAFLVITRDGGATHEVVDHSSWTPPTRGGKRSWLIENWVVPAASTVAPDDGNAVAALPLQQGFRTQLGFILEAVAENGFEKGFAAARYTAIPNPDSKTSAVRLTSMPSQSGGGSVGKTIGFALACNDAYNRNLLSLYSGNLRNGRVQFNERIVVLENSTEWQSDYPTVQQGVKEGEIFVSYTCFSHTGACFAIVNTLGK